MLMANPVSSHTSLLSRVRMRLRRELSDRLARRPAIISYRQPVVSFTFDDFPASAVENAGNLLSTRGFHATYYAALGLMDTNSPTGRIFGPAELKAVVDQGHELGCHTYSPCHAWDTSPAPYKSSIEENLRAISGLHPQAIIKSHSFPISVPRPSIKRLASGFFESCRCGGMGFNSGSVDLNSLQSVFLEKLREDFSSLRQLIATNSKAKGWLILTTHDVTETPTRFGVTPGFFADTLQCVLDSGAIVLPVSAALARGLTGGRAAR